MFWKKAKRRGGGRDVGRMKPARRRKGKKNEKERERWDRKRKAPRGEGGFRIFGAEPKI